MTEQKEHYDEHIARYRALLERYGLTPPELTDSIDKHKIFYLFCRIVYAIEDSLSFLFGNIKLYFSLIASYYQQSDAGAADDLHHSLQSLTDLFIIIGLGIPLVIVQVLGAYFSDSKDLNSNKLKYFFAKILALYLRDILQGIKWAYKSMRSVLNMIFYFMASHKELVIKILFPLSIAIAVLSLLNRIFLRTLRNIRKQKQSSNRKASVEALEEGYVLKFRQEMPTEPKDLAKLKNSLVYIPDNDNCKIFYVNPEGTAKAIELETSQINNITATVQQFQSENIRRRIELAFVNNNDIKKVYFLEKEPSNTEECKKYKDSLIFLTNKDLDKSKKLIKIDSEGNIHRDSKSSEYFVKAIANEISSKNALNLYSYQIDEIVNQINFTPEHELGISLTEWKKNKLGKKPETLDNRLIFFCYLSVILSALIDGSYFYFGVIFMAIFNPAAFIAMIAMAATMMMVCLVGRIYEEYCYQKAFKISQCEIDLNIKKTETNILNREIEKIIQNINEENYEDSEKRLQDLLSEFREAILEYANQQKKLESQIRISGTEAFLKGLRNGLSTQGVISALMFVGVTIMVLTGTTCPPAFIISMMVIGFAVLIRSVYRYMESYYVYKKNDVELPQPKIPKINCENIDTMISSFYTLKETKITIEEQLITKPPNLFEEEYSEVVRLACSAFTKAENNFGQCLLGEPRHGEEWWITLTSLIFSGGMAVIFSIRGIHKMFSTPDENPNVVPNKEIKPSTNYTSKFFNSASKPILRGSPTPSSHKTITANLPPIINLNI